MAQQTVNVGTTTNDGKGDPLRTSFIKINQNTDELYKKANAAITLTIITGY